VAATPPAVAKARATEPETAVDSAQEANPRTAWKHWADETSDEAALSSLSHRIAADRDKSVTTALSCLSAATAAVAGRAPALGDLAGDGLPTLRLRVV
jgi:hypothetical protein